MKRKTLVAVAGVEGLILLILLANSLGWPSFLPEFSLCGGEICAMAQSPDRKRTAYAFERDVARQRVSTTFLIVRDSKAKLDLTEDLIEDEILFAADGIYQPNLKWPSNDRLQVSSDSFGAPTAADVSFQIVKKGNLTVDYKSNFK